MIETVLFSFMFARIKGYKWKEIFKLFKHWSIYPILFTSLIHIYFIYSIIHSEYWFLEYSKYIKTMSILFYLSLIWKYKLIDISIFPKIKLEDKPILTTITSPVSLGILFMGFGSVLNYTVMKLNNLKMPVFPSVSISIGYTKLNMFDKIVQYKDFHILGGFTTHMIFLSDIFDGFFTIMSIGDILTRMFVVLVIYYSVKTCNQANIIIDN
jgi:hypothetical protein